MITEDEIEQIVQRRLNEELSKFNIAGASGYGTQWALPQSHDSSRAEDGGGNFLEDVIIVRNGEGRYFDVNVRDTEGTPVDA